MPSPYSYPDSAVAEGCTLNALWNDIDMASLSHQTLGDTGAQELFPTHGYRNSSRQLAGDILSPCRQDATRSANHQTQSNIQQLEHMPAASTSRQTEILCPCDPQESNINQTWPLPIQTQFENRQRLLYPDPIFDPGSSSTEYYESTGSDSSYVLQNQFQAATRAPSIAFRPAVTYEDGVDFQGLFADDFSSIRKDPSDYLSVPRGRSPDSSTEPFYNSPAFSAGALPGTPITDSKNLAQSSNHWNDFDNSSVISGEEFASWGVHPSEQAIKQTDNLTNNEYLSMDWWNALPSQQDIHQASPVSTADDVANAYLMPPPLMDRNLVFPDLDCGKASRDEWTETYIAQPSLGSGMSEIPTSQNQITLVDTRQNSKGDTLQKRKEQLEKTQMEMLLIRLKNEGLSYRDIKTRSGFKGAESTLRGRYRALTKRKEDRVRKPEWQDRDIKLLIEAVRIANDPTQSAFHGNGTSKVNKVSWKRVARYIKDNGGSYLYGNATCKKKWMEIQGLSGG